MKKITALIIGIAIISGCESKPAKPVSTSSTQIQLDGAFHRHQMKKLEFEGHKYLFIDGYRQGGLEHDPNCSCHIMPKID